MCNPLEDFFKSCAVVAEELSYKTPLVLFSHVAKAHLFKSMPMFICVCLCWCASLCAVSVPYHFLYSSLCMAASSTWHSHTVWKWKAESQETCCRIHTVWKTSLKTAGLTLWSTWHIWRQLCYQPSFLCYMIVAKQIQPTWIWIQNCQVWVPGILTILKPNSIWGSLALKM